MSDPQAAITSLAEEAAERFLARYLEETGSPGTLHDCTVFKVGYTDGLSEAARELTAAITTLTAQLAAQRAIVAADTAYLVTLCKWADNPASRPDSGPLWRECQDTREEAKRIDKEAGR